MSQAQDLFQRFDSACADLQTLAGGLMSRVEFLESVSGELGFVQAQLNEILDVLEELHPLLKQTVE
jgi:hypothetical protein